MQRNVMLTALGFSWLLVVGSLERPVAAQERAPAIDKAALAAIEKHGGYLSGRGAVPMIMFRFPGCADKDLKTLAPHLVRVAPALHLNLNTCKQVSDAGVAHLKELKNLRGLSLGGTQVTDASLALLPQWSDLVELYIANDTVTDAGVTHVRKLPRLRVLGVWGKQVTAAGLENVKDLTSLEELSGEILTRDLTDDRLAHLRNLTRLRRLTIEGKNVTDAGLLHLKGLTELRELRLETPQGTDRGLAVLRTMPKLEKLTIFHRLGIGQASGITARGLENLKDLGELREATLLFSNPISEDGLAHLKGLKKLARLQVEGFTDKALAHLVDSASLRDLSLLSNPITDAGLKTVGKMTRLEALDIRYTRITDAGLPHLKGLTRLRLLNATLGNRLSKEAVAELQKALPMTKIY